MNNNPMKYYGNYRGVVVANNDPENKGRVKIFVPGVYHVEMSQTPDKLPWAEPAMGLGGGNYATNKVNTVLLGNDENPQETTVETSYANNETGINTIPLIGAELWIFFEAGDHNAPIYFASCQGGSGWVSEHVDQHTYQSKNVKVVIDENPDSTSSTNKFNSNSSLQTEAAKSVINRKENASGGVNKEMPTRVNVKIDNPGNCALNLIINGDVNVKVTGDYYEEIRGNKYETIRGHHFVRHIGDYEKIHDGSHNEVHQPLGKNESVNHRVQVIGDSTKIVSGEDLTRCLGNKTIDTIGNLNFKIKNNFSANVKGYSKEEVMGPKTIHSGKLILNIDGDTLFSFDAFSLNMVGDIALTSQYGRILIDAAKDILISSDVGDLVMKTKSARKHIIMDSKGNIEQSALGQMILKSLGPWGNKYDKLQKYPIIEDPAMPPEYTLANIVTAGSFTPSVDIPNIEFEEGVGIQPGGIFLESLNGQIRQDSFSKLNWTRGADFETEFSNLSVTKINPLVFPLINTNSELNGFGTVQSYGTISQPISTTDFKYRFGVIKQLKSGSSTSYEYQLIDSWVQSLLDLLEGVTDPLSMIVIIVTWLQLLVLPSGTSEVLLYEIVEKKGILPLYTLIQTIIDTLGIDLYDPTQKYLENYIT